MYNDCNSRIRFAMQVLSFFGKKKAARDPVLDGEFLSLCDLFELNELLSRMLKHLLTTDTICVSEPVDYIPNANFFLQELKDVS